MNQQPSRQTASTLLAIIVTMLEWISSFVLVAMMLLTFVDVIGRYLLNKPIFGAAELVSMLLAFTIFCGLGLVNAKNQHIAVDLFEPAIRQAFPRFHAWLTQGASLLAMALLVYVLFEQAYDAAAVDSRTVVLEISLAWIAGLVAALSAVSLICQILELIIGKPIEDEITGVAS